MIADGATIAIQTTPKNSTQWLEATLWLEGHGLR
jgi:hypothetical protein